MPVMSNLLTALVFDENFSKTLVNTPDTKKAEIVRNMWPSLVTRAQIEEAALYFAFSRHFLDELSTIRHRRDTFTTCTLESITNTVQTLQEMCDHPLEEIVRCLKDSFINCDESAIQRSIEMCLRLWLTININSRAVTVGGTFHREVALEWPQSTSPNRVVETLFAQKAASQGSEAGVTVGGSFTAEYLVNNCGLEIVWTNYLTDHLRLDPTRRVLLIYRHKIHLNDQLSRTAHGPIPNEVCKEALDTMNLLFPFGNEATKQLLAKYGEQALYDLGACGRGRLLDLSRYKYWRTELEVLAEIFHSPPRTWKQLALDRRNKLEWSAFWITVMVGFLTLISIPCNIIQATYSVKAYHATIAQNNIVGKREL